MEKKTLEELYIMRARRIQHQLVALYRMKNNLIDFWFEDVAAIREEYILIDDI